ncbi:MAG: YhcN/YlaJ family sporulation lipoprotein [Desulfitobacterium hafniense]|nr:YhcN/YlaJ family sporulation lipoprotein [Desulfitobacterium hafniense]
MRVVLKKPVILIFVLLLGVSLLSGCPPQRKPEVTPTPPPGPTAPDNRIAPAPAPAVPGPRTQVQARDAADDIADKVAAVRGVNKASVVVVGNVALIGLDLDKDVEKGQTEAIREKAANEAKDDPRIVNAVVETDPDSVGRIQKIADGVRKGRPITEFFDEIGEFFNRLKPTT